MYMCVRACVRAYMFVCVCISMYVCVLSVGVGNLPLWTFARYDDINSYIARHFYIYNIGNYLRQRQYSRL